MGHDSPHNRTCNAADCDALTPMDMPAIHLDETWFCSPACARSHLDQTDDAPAVVALHDPQFAVSRDAFDGVSEDAVRIQRPVADAADARSAVDTFASQFPGAFRGVPADG